MSLLSQASRLNTANQINTWNTLALESMGTAKQNFTSLATQRIAMEGNKDFDDSDRAELDTILANLIDMAKSLIPTE